MDSLAWLAAPESLGYLLPVPEQLSTQSQISRL